VTFNNAINGVLQNNPNNGQSKSAGQVDGYKRPLVSSLSENLQRFGIERVSIVESLHKITAEISESDDNPATAHQK
jgi:hypothetical protein